MCGKINLNQIKFNFIGEERNKQEKTQRKPNKKTDFVLMNLNLYGIMEKAKNKCYENMKKKKNDWCKIMMQSADIEIFFEK